MWYGLDGAPSARFFVGVYFGISEPFVALLAAVKPPGEYNSAREGAVPLLGGGFVQHDIINVQFGRKRNIKLDVVDALAFSQGTAGALGTAGLEHVGCGSFPFTLQEVDESKVGVIVFDKAVDLHTEHIGTLEEMAEAEVCVGAHRRTGHWVEDDGLVLARHAATCAFQFPSRNPHTCTRAGILPRGMMCERLRDAACSVEAINYRVSNFTYMSGFSSGRRS